MTPTQWQAQARCRGADPSIFYPEPGSGGAINVAAAIRICRGCPSKAPCLAWALEHGEQGVWGATSDKERHRMRRGKS